MNSIIKCPVCHQPLTLADKTWFCEAGHRYDLAKQGYCNLLLANQKQSKQPGDSREMMLARHAFLSAGYYQKVATKLAELISQHVTTPVTHIADAGCGEGYYLQQLETALTTDAQLYGTDISREAIKLAASQNKSIHWLVAASRQLPFMDSSLDLILNIFAPADWQEFERCLSHNGMVLLAVAGPQHLYELRQLIYQQPEEHNPERFLQSCSPAFELMHREEIRYRIELNDNTAIRQLLTMTPYFWKTPKQQQLVIENLQSLTTTVNFQFFLMKVLHKDKD